MAAARAVGGKNARGSILVIGGSAETLGAVLLAAEARHAGRRGQAAGRDGRLAGAAVAAQALPEALVRALPETADGAIRADAADEVRDLAESADAVLIGPGMADKEETQALRRAAAAAPDRPAGPRRARPVLRHRRHRLRAPPEGPGGPHAQPDRDRLRAARGRGRDRRPTRPGPPSTSPDAPRRSSGLGGATSLDRRPRRPALAGRERQRRARRLRVRRRAGRASPAGLLARGAEPAQAAVWAAYLHGRAGERLASSIGPLGFLARELPAEVPAALAEITADPRRRSAAGCAEVRRVADNYIAELPFGAPKIDDEAFVAPTAVVVGAVTMGAQSSIWYSAVARADDETIEIGERLQRAGRQHAALRSRLPAGHRPGVTVGHRVILHGARIDDDVLVGMGAS